MVSGPSHETKRLLSLWKLSSILVLEFETPVFEITGSRFVLYRPLERDVSTHGILRIDAQRTNETRLIRRVTRLVNFENSRERSNVRLTQQRYICCTICIPRKGKKNTAVSSEGKKGKLSPRSLGKLGAAMNRY